MVPDLKDMLLFARKSSGTELHVTVDGPIEIVVAEKRRRLNLPSLTRERFDSLIRQLLDDNEYSRLGASGSVASMFELDEVGLVTAKISNGSASFVLQVNTMPASPAAAQSRPPFGLHRLTKLLGAPVTLVSREFFFGRIFPLPFLLIGAVTLYFTGSNPLQAYASTSWPVAQGKIEQSVVKASYSSAGSRTFRPETYKAEVDYRYTVAAVSFVGHRVAFGDYGSSDPTDAEEVVSRYPTGSNIEVRYDPASPEESVLDPGIKIQAFFAPAAGLAFLLAGLVMAFFLPRAFRVGAKSSKP